MPTTQENYSGVHVNHVDGLVQSKESVQAIVQVLQFSGKMQPVPFR